MSLLFHMQSRLVITFLSKSKHLLISWLQPPSTVILEPPKIVCQCFHCFPIYLPWCDSMDMNLNKLREILKDRGPCHAAVHGVAKSLTWLNSNSNLPTYFERSKSWSWGQKDCLTIGSNVLCDLSLRTSLDLHRWRSYENLARKFHVQGLVEDLAH